MARRSLPDLLKIGAASAVLLIVAVLQYNWIGQVSEAEVERLKERLRTASHGFAADFDREVTRAYLTFLSGPPELFPEVTPAEIARSWRRWRETAPWPALLAEVLSVDRGPDLFPEWQRLDPASGRLVPADPATLEALAHRLDPWSHPPWARTIIEEVPALMVPLGLWPGGRGRGPGSGSQGMRQGMGLGRRGRERPGGWLFLVLDHRELHDAFLPALERRWFLGAGLDDAVLTVHRRHDPEAVIYRSATAGPGRGPGTDSDLSLEILALRPFPELADLVPVHDLESLPVVGTGGHWTLEVGHRVGSLEDAVARVRWRNLSISFAVLALLATSLVFLAASTRRVRNLARQQMEFVASVTHELHTPLAAIRSAAQNLQDGVVEDAGQVRRYGAMIESEGRRLTDMVSQVLGFAGMQSGQRAYSLRPVDAGEIVDAVLEDYRWILEEKGFHVEKDVAAGLPALRADPSALRQAVGNLVGNALKYGGREKWLRIEVEGPKPGTEGPAAGGPAAGVPAAGDLREIRIRVTDRGPGIEPGDLPRLFEPFYRGRHVVAAGEVAGSGLGLTLVRHVVEAHGGRVSVDSRRGAGGRGGARFTIHLPVAEETV